MANEGIKRFVGSTEEEVRLFEMQSQIKGRPRSFRLRRASPCVKKTRLSHVLCDSSERRFGEVLSCSANEEGVFYKKSS